MDAKIAVTNPQSVKFTLTITMSLEDWILVKSRLESVPSSWAGHQIISAIRDMVCQASKSFWPKLEDKETP